MRGHASQVRTPKEIDAYIDRVYDLLAEGEQLNKGQVSVAVPPFTSTLTEFTQPAKLAVNALVTLRRDTPGGQDMDVAQLEQLQALRQQQTILTEQSQAVRKLLQEYDAAEAVQPTTFVDFTDIHWPSPGFTMNATSSSVPTRSQTLKSLCQQQRRTTQVLKAMGSAATAELMPPAATERKVVITLEDVHETARLPPNSKLLEGMHLKERLPSQIKLQELLKEQSKQLAESHAKYKTANKVVTLWRQWIEHATADRRALHTAKGHHLQRNLRTALYRLRWFVALQKHTRQCEITVIVDRLDKGWELFRRKTFERKRQLILTEQARWHYLRTVFEHLKVRLLASRKSTILVRAAWHVHIRVAWRRFVRITQQKSCHRRALWQRGSSIRSHYFARHATRFFNALRGSVSRKRAVVQRRQSILRCQISMAMAQLQQRCESLRHARKTSMLAQRHFCRQGLQGLRNALQRRRQARSFATIQRETHTMRSRMLLVTAIQSLQKHCNRAHLARFSHVLQRRYWFRKWHSYFEQKYKERSIRKQLIRHVHIRHCWNRFRAAACTWRERRTASYWSTDRAYQLRWARACHAALNVWREFMVHRHQYRQFTSRSPVTSRKLLAHQNEVDATAGLRAEQVGCSRFRARSLRDALSGWVEHVQNRIADSVQIHECTRRFGQAQLQKHFAQWHSWTTSRVQKEDTEGFATCEFVRWRLSGGFREWMFRTAATVNIRSYHDTLLGEMQVYYLARVLYNWRVAIYQQHTSRDAVAQSTIAMAFYHKRMAFMMMRKYAHNHKRRAQNLMDGLLHRRLSQSQNALLHLKQHRLRVRNQRSRHKSGQRHREQHTLKQAWRNWRSIHRRKMSARKAIRRAYETGRGYKLMTIGWQSLHVLRRNRRHCRMVADQMDEHYEEQLVARGFRRIKRRRDRSALANLLVLRCRTRARRQQLKESLRFWRLYAKHMEQFRIARHQLLRSRNRRALKRVWAAMKKWFRQARVDTRKSALVRLSHGRKATRRHFAQWRHLCRVKAKLKRLQALYVKAHTHTARNSFRAVLVEANQSTDRALSHCRHRQLRTGFGICKKMLPKRRLRHVQKATADRGRLRHTFSAFTRFNNARHCRAQQEKQSVQKGKTHRRRVLLVCANAAWVLHSFQRLQLKARLLSATKVINRSKLAQAMYMLYTYCKQRLSNQAIELESATTMQLNGMMRTWRRWLEFCNVIRWQKDLEASVDPVCTTNRQRQMMQLWRQHLHTRLSSWQSLQQGSLKYQATMFRRWSKLMACREAARAVTVRATDAWVAFVLKRFFRRVIRMPTIGRKQSRHMQQATRYLRQRGLVQAMHWLRACVTIRRSATAIAARRNQCSVKHWWGVWRRNWLRQQAIQAMVTIVQRVAQRVKIAQRFRSWKSTAEKLKRLELFIHNKQNGFMWRTFHKYHKIIHAKQQRKSQLQVATNAWERGRCRTGFRVWYQGCNSKSRVQSRRALAMHHNRQHHIKAALRVLKRFADAAVRHRARSACDRHLLAKATLHWRLQLVLSKTAKQRCDHARRWQAHKQQTTALYRLWQYRRRRQHFHVSRSTATRHFTMCGQRQFRERIQHSSIKQEVRREFYEIADSFWGNTRKHRFLFALQLHALKSTARQHYFPELVQAVHALRARRVFKEWLQLLPPSVPDTRKPESDIDEEDDELPILEDLNSSYAQAYARVVAERLDWVPTACPPRTPIKSH